MNFGQILAEIFYTLIGIIFILVGVKALKDPGAQKKGTTAAFWFLLAFTFICGNWIPKWIVGVAILCKMFGQNKKFSDVVPAIQNNATSQSDSTMEKGENETDF